MRLFFVMLMALLIMLWLSFQALSTFSCLFVKCQHEKGCHIDNALALFQKKKKKEGVKQNFSVYPVKVNLPSILIVQAHM